MMTENIITSTVVSHEMDSSLEEPYIVIPTCICPCGFDHELNHHTRYTGKKIHENNMRVSSIRYNMKNILVNGYSHGDLMCFY